MSKHKFNIHYRGSPWGSRTQQHAYCLRYAHSQYIESHLGKKQQQAKIPIAFLFSQLHFNNVTSHALFYGSHLVMRSKRCAMQNQGITLNGFFFHCQQNKISNFLCFDLIGNRTLCRPIRSVIILVIKQIGLPLRGRPICNHSYDYRPNWTPLSPVTITNRSVFGQSPPTCGLGDEIRLKWRIA